MLQLIRDNAQGIIIWIIVGLVILGLSSFILTDYLGGNVKTYVAKVNDVEISDREFRQAYNNMQLNLRQQLGENFSRFMNEDMLRENVLNGLVNNELLRQLTDEAGFRANDALVYQTLQANDQFHDDTGKFSAARYRELLERVNYSSEAYEMELGRSIVQEQLRNAIQQSAFTLDNQYNDYYRLLHQQRDIGYLQISRTVLGKEVSVSQEEIRNHYEAHKSEFMTEEQVQVAYLELNQADMAKAIEVDEEELLAYYESHKASYTRDDFSAAEKQIRDIAARIRKGESFEKLAKEHSQDPGTAINGGDLGFFARGIMSKPFEEAVFHMQVGELSEPVRTEFGFHLIKLEEVQQDGQEQRRARHILIKPDKTTQAFADVKQRITAELQLQKAERVFYQDADTLDRLAYQHQDSLEPAAAALGRSIKESPFFSRRGGVQIFQNRDVIDAAFSSDVLTDGLNSELIKLSDDHLLVLRLKAHKPAEQKPLENVMLQIETLLRQQKASARASEVAAQAQQDLAAGKQPAEIAAAHAAIEWIDTGLIGRQAQYDKRSAPQTEVNQEVRTAAFRMARPAEQVRYETLTLANGDAAVIVLRAVKEPDSPVPVEERAALQRQLAQARAQMHDRLLLEYQRAHSEIEITQQNQLAQDY